MSVLIIGGNSSIGSQLCHHLTKTNTKVITTSRRSDVQHALWLDLADDQSVNNFQVPKVDSCIFLASVTSMADCENSPLTSHKINVSNTIKILEKLNTNKVYTIFPSSNQVFDAHSPSNTLSTTPLPNNNYGSMKLEVEKYIQHDYPNAAILRLGKIIGKQFPLIEQFLFVLLLLFYQNKN